MRRARKVPRNEERVLILGASSGIGQALAHEYAARGARVCVVARRELELLKVVQECTELQKDGINKPSDPEQKICSFTADFTNIEDMVRVRTALQDVWQGVDTLVVCAGISLTRNGLTFTPPQTDAEAIQKTVDVATKLSNVNYIGPLVSAVAFLGCTVHPPDFFVAALIPPPTRSFYAATKAASLMFYQVLAIEHPSVAFTFAIPATVRGEFRASAINGVSKEQAAKEQGGLRQDVVAKRCVQAVDVGEKRIFMPWLLGRETHTLYWIIPSFLEWQISRTYKFS
ncbi:NAD(P)-binding protein [Amylocystis lapponica]|nr:NAD(P)-binding protein [Amylocystis lapponica]